MEASLVYPLIAATVLPYVFTIIAKVGAFGPKNNHETRDWQGRLEGWRKRAHWAQLNSFEVLPMFIAAVFAAGLRAGATDNVLYAAWGFIALRVLYGAVYLADMARTRSMTFFAGVGCVVFLFVEALRA